MDIRILHYFVTIAQEKNITRAAERLLITQPTLSRQLKELEEELGVSLFHRANREMTLTEDGQYLYNRAQEILQLVSKTEENLAEAAEGGLAEPSGAGSKRDPHVFPQPAQAPG